MQTTDQRFFPTSHHGVVAFRFHIVRFLLFSICLGLLFFSAGCSSAPENRNDSALAIDESVGPADIAAMATGSWQIRNENQRGMALLGGLLAYDMTTTEKLDGLAMTEKRVSAGPLWLAGKTESRALQPGGEEGHGNWFFPFFEVISIKLIESRIKLGSRIIVYITEQWPFTGRLAKTPSAYCQTSGDPATAIGRYF